MYVSSYNTTASTLDIGNSKNYLGINIMCTGSNYPKAIPENCYPIMEHYPLLHSSFGCTWNMLQECLPFEIGMIMTFLHKS